jgi:hypothetical protein
MHADDAYVAAIEVERDGRYLRTPVRHDGGEIGECLLRRCAHEFRNGAQPTSSSVQALRPNRTRRARSRPDHTPSQNAIASESPGSIHAHANNLRVSAPRRATTVNPPQVNGDNLGDTRAHEVRDGAVARVVKHEAFATTVRNAKGRARALQLRDHRPNWLAVHNGPTPEALVRVRERTYFEYFWNDFAADQTHSIPEADRVAYTVAYARSGRMRAGWAYFVSFQQAAKDFAELSKTKLTMPVLAIGGEKANGELLGQQMKIVASDATTVVLKDTGHWVLEEKPVATTAALLKFL